MSQETNLLRAQGKRFIAPLAAFALIVTGGALVMGHRHVDAATSPDTPTTPIDNASIDPLLALDQATEAVASRVTPAVVNIAVTARAPEQSAEAEGGDDNPFSQFFGPQGPQGPQGRGFGQGQGMGPMQGQRQIEH